MSAADPAAGHAPEPHGHEPYLLTPPGDGAFVVSVGGVTTTVSLALLQNMPYCAVAGCWIVSTGHGRSGPFCFGGVAVSDLMRALAPAHAWSGYADFVGADGYCARLTAARIAAPPAPLIAYMLDGAPMRRAQGLVRLIVPDAFDDALLQVKWLARIEAPAAPT